MIEFEFTDCMSPGERMVHVARTALEPGPMGKHLRGDYYREFVACGFPIDLSGVKTSCAVFAGAVRYWAGHPVKTRKHIGQGIFNGWLEGLYAPGHPDWVNAKDAEPEPGAIFYRAYSLRSSGQESHVGVFVERTEDGLWITAEGGGGFPPNLPTRGLTSAQIKATNGTVCKLSATPKNVYAKDSLGRVLCGWWLPKNGP